MLRSLKATQQKWALPKSSTACHLAPRFTSFRIGQKDYYETMDSYWRRLDRSTIKNLFAATEIMKSEPAGYAGSFDSLNRGELL